ncbi:MAG: cytochrome-c peroxidase, partial [Pseudobdellovibrionaceae bacterium]
MGLSNFSKLLTLVAAFSLESAAMAFEVLPKVNVPKDNLMTPEKIELGRQLFFDPRLSKTGTVSCNSCHNVMAGGEDNRATSIGVFGKQGGRSAPTVWNAAYLSVQFWDGRASTLEEQAKGPMTNPVEMGMESHDLVVQKISSLPGYQRQFKKVFSDSTKITIDNVAKAIATYERTLVTPNSPFDRFLEGDKEALNLSAKRGMQLVQNIGCVSCHSGPNIAGPRLPVGQGFFQKFPLFPNADLEIKYQYSKVPGRFESTKKE